MHFIQVMFVIIIDKLIILCLNATQGHVVASLAEAQTMPLMQCPLLVRAGIWDLFSVPAIARLLFVKDNMGSLTAANKCLQTGHPGSQPFDGQHTH